MKKFLRFIFLMPMVILSTSCGGTTSSEIKEPTPVDVVVISGQSNGVGCTKAEFIKRSMGASKYQDYMEGYPEIQIAYDCWTKDDGPRFYSQNKSKNNTFFKVMLGQGNGLSTFGPEIGIAETMHEKYANKLFLIKFACGASNLKDDWVEEDSPMYARFVNYVKLQMTHLKEMGYLPTIKALCWMQGEGDSYLGYYEHYYDNTKKFVGNLRRDLLEESGNKEFAFIDAGISNSTMWQYYRHVNNAKKQFAEESENNVYIDTIAAGLHVNQEPYDTPDLAHYDSESEVLLGKLFAENFEPFLEPIE